MAGNFKMPNKKTTIIISIIIAILAIIAVTGTVVFLKDRGSTEAAELDNGQVSREEATTTQDTPNEQTMQTQTAENVGGQNAEGEGTTEVTSATGDATEAGTTDAVTTTTEAGTVTGTATTTDTIQETTISRTEEVQIPERQISEGHYVGWTPMQINAEMASANIVAQRADLTINKIAKTKNSENLVTKGEVITYEISVKNNSEKELTGIEIKDKIPVMTEYKKDSANNNGEEILNGKTVVGLKWNIDLKAGEEKVVSFQVTVLDEATGKIANVAVVNGETTQTVEIAIVTANKTAIIEGKEEGQPAKVGDKITYTITVANTGDIAGKINVKDEFLAKLVEDGILKIDEASKEVANKVMEGTWVDVPANGEGKISFTAIVEKINGAIKNVATVGEEETEKTVDTVNISAEKTNTDTDNKVKPGDTFDYTIVLTNSGNTKGTAKVTDSVPEQLEVTKTTPTATVEGNNVDFGDVTVAPGTPVTLTISVKVKATATGTFKNIALADEEEIPDEDITIENVPKISAVKTNNDTDKKVKPGDTVVYTIKLSNSGNAEGTTTVTDKLPAGVIYQSSSDNGVYNNGTVIWENVNVPLGTNSKELTVTVTIDKTATGKLENTAIVENETEHDEGLDIVKITANKSSNITTRAKVGQEVIYTITAINNGTTAGDAVITDQIPNSLEYKEATLTVAGQDTISVDNGLVTWNVKGLEPGEANARTLTIKATIKDFEGTITTITNEVKVDGEKTSETTIEAGKPVITSSKTSEIISCPERNELTGTTIHEGDKIKYTITVNNTGSIEKEITITDEIKSGLTYVDGTLTVQFAGATISGAKVENGVVKLENYTLTTGGTLTITFTVEVNELPEGESSKTIDSNVAIVDGTEKEDEKGDYEVLKPVITSEKESRIENCTKGQTTGTIVHENDPIKYTIKVSNTGRASGKVTVEDMIKEGLTYVEGTAKATVDNVAVSGIAVSNGKVSLTDYTLAAGKTIVIEFTAKVNSLPEGVYSKTIATNVAVVNGNNTTDTTGEYNVVKSNIESEKTSAIIECSVNKTEENVVHVSDKIRYTIKVENNGTDSDVINVTDDIPTGVTYVEGTLNAKLNDNTQVPVTIEGRQVKLSAYTLEAGKTLTISFDVIVDTLEDGVYSKTIANNIAVVNGQDIPDNGGYEVQKPQIESSKVVDKTKAEYNEELTYTITVKNISTIAADINISDPIPEGAEYIPNSITVNGKAVTDTDNYADGKIVYTGTLAKQNETLTITFKVKITEKIIGTDITNIANINGEEKQATTKVIKTVTVGTESAKVTPIDLVLVLDVSGSMKGDRLTDLKSSATTLVNKVFAYETTSTISVITYSSEVKSVNTYTYAQRSNLTTAINGLTANGGTNIYAALNQANTTVSGLGTEREKVVVFLTDGAPTIPSNLYIDGVHTENNSGSGYTNNIKNPIVERANSLKALSKVKKVYSIGLGVNSLSDKTISYAEECTVTTLNEDVKFDKANHTFTITITNPTNVEVTLEEVNAIVDNVEGLSNLSSTGKTSEYRGSYYASWENIVIAANGSVTLTGAYEPSYGFISGNEREPEISIDTGYTGVCTTEAHNEQFNGSALFSETKVKNGKQYHCITTQDYAKYLLSKISSDGTSMNVDTVSTAFDKILQDISSDIQIHTIEEGTIMNIPETRTIISDVTVKIGDSSNTYTLAQLKKGVDGLVYKENVGFTWTITGDNLLTNKLSLDYKVNE